LTVKVQPISIKLEGNSVPGGYCNQKLLQKLKNNECFYLVVRKSRKKLPLDVEELKNDSIIKKFLKAE